MQFQQGFHAASCLSCCTAANWQRKAFARRSRRWTQMKTFSSVSASICVNLRAIPDSVAACRSAGSNRTIVKSSPGLVVIERRKPSPGSSQATGVPRNSVLFVTQARPNTAPLPQCVFRDLAAFHRHPSLLNRRDQRKRKRNSSSSPSFASAPQK